jgi:hypothetical protein
VNLDSYSGRRELLKMCGNACNGASMNDEFEKLQAVLLADATARHLYIRYLYVHHALATFIANGDKQLAVSDKPKATRSPALQRLETKLIQLSQVTSGLADARDGIKMQPRQAVLWSIALAVNAIVVVLLSMAVTPQFWQRGDLAQPQLEKAGSITTAKLTSAIDCKWIGDVPTVGSHFTAQTVALHSGAVRLEFGDGAEVALEGPCELDLQTPGRGYLRLGKLLATVPRRAIGFTVETPSAKIVDLGTEFAVETDQQKQTEIHVFTGKVTFEPTASVGPLLPARTLRAGEAVRVARGAVETEPAVRSVPIDLRRRLVDSKPDGIDRLLPVVAVIGSSSWRDLYKPEWIINGSGLEPGPGDILLKRHNESPLSGNGKGGMWLTADNETTGYVAFDFGRVCTVTGFHVWNYAAVAYKNTIDDTDRGAKEVDVYADVTNAFPTTLVQSFLFEMAMAPPSTTFVGHTTWGGDYQVAGVTYVFDRPINARYIKFDIKSNHGDPEYVGLSEVRFIGKPADSNPRSEK